MQSGDDVVPPWRYVPTPALWRGRIVTDLPPVVQALGMAICRTPDELLASRASLGYPTYAVRASDDCVTWYFSDDLQEAVALGLKWLERGCALVQIPEEQDGVAVYAYVARGLEDDLDHLFYSRELWDAAGGDMNEAATPEIMTRLRVELFKFIAEWGWQFTMLDFSNPADVTAYLEDWVNELEPE